MKAVRFVLLLAVVALAPAVAWAAAGAGLQGTAHDFSNKAVTGGNKEQFTTGLCTFCHTPHRAIQSQVLWNHTLSSATFKWDVSTTTAGTSYPQLVGDTYKGPTTKCLSCHDGSVAIGDVAWFGEGKPAVALDTTKHAWPDAFNVGARDGNTGSMKGNHPVAMPYPNWNGASSTYNSITTGNGSDANITRAEWQANPESLNIRLYNDDGAGFITAGPVASKTGIECSSCHDPHNKASKDDMFLRGTISSNGYTTDYICLKCHIK